MPRALDPDQFLAAGAVQPAAPDVDPSLALAMYGVRLQLPGAPLLRRCFHAIAAMFQAAHNLKGSALPADPKNKENENPEKYQKVF